MLRDGGGCIESSGGNPGGNPGGSCGVTTGGVGSTGPGIMGGGTEVSIFNIYNKSCENVSLFSQFSYSRDIHDNQIENNQLDICICIHVKENWN